MGNYLNPGNEKFRRMIQSEIYVDKTGMIKYTNSVLDTAQNYVCVSRPRRFGKSMAANMLTAYYSRGCDSKKLFHSFEIAKDKDFEKYLNQYNTIFLNMQEFLSRSYNVEKLIERVKKLVIRDLKMEYPEVDYFDDTDLIESMQDVYAQTQCPFVVIIDEWDCIFREYKKFAIITPILVIIEVFMNIAIPYYMSLLIDRGILGYSKDEIIKIGLILIIFTLISLYTII